MIVSLLTSALFSATPALAAEGDAKRGAYVADLAGCGTCHISGMGPDAKPWQGGLTINEGPPGTWVSPNITQDKATGIGGWTDEQITKAIREGVRPDGTRLKPIMPYPYYNAMSDQDAADLVAFLRTLPAVENKVEPGDFNVPPVPVPPANGKGIPDRGEYVTTIAHCHVCHTPMDDKGAPDATKAFAGGRPFAVPPQMGGGVMFSPNITPHKEKGIGGWTDEQIITSYTKMVRPDGRGIAPPMALYAPHWSKLTKEDNAALVGYLKKLPAIDHAPPPNTAKPPPPK